MTTSYSSLEEHFGKFKTFQSFSHVHWYLSDAVTCSTRSVVGMPIILEHTCRLLLA